MEGLLQLALGFALTMLSGVFVKHLLAALRRAVAVPEISGDPIVEGWWLQLTAHLDKSGVWIGNVERMLFFVGICTEAWELVGVWVLFKVAAKWEAWNHMGYVPEVPSRGGEAAAHPLRWAHARRVWAAQGYATFVVGTGCNFILGLIGVFAVDFDEWVLTTIG